MLDNNGLRREAERVRRAFEVLARQDGGKLKAFPRQCCDIATRVLRLYDAGLRDFAEHLAYAEEDRLHRWLDVDGLVVDITADQFGEPAVVVSGEPPQQFAAQLLGQDNLSIMHQRCSGPRRSPRSTIMWLRRTATLLAVLLLVRQVAGGESSDQLSEGERRLQIIQDTADAYTLYDNRRVDRALTRTEKPLLKFEDPVTMATRGGVYVWSDDNKRPLAIASIYFRGDGARVDEFQSLSDAGLVAKYKDEVVWRPSVPGIEWEVLTGDIPGTKPLRLGRMREFARQFTASVRDTKSGRQELRLLPQPIYRYEDGDSGIVDGAVFCYAKGTNPEVLLLLQAETSEGRTQWKRTFCRMTERECEVISDNEVVWTVAKAPIPQKPDEPYFNLTTK